MVNGLATASMGMRHAINKQDVLSNNLANVQSSGFKLAKLVTSTEVDIRPNDEGLLVQREEQIVDDVFLDFSPGPLIETQNPFDVSLRGAGFLEVQSGQEVVYTRSGHFAKSEEGFLVTLSGDRVLSDLGSEIALDGEKMTISEDGGVFVDGLKVAQLGLKNFAQTQSLQSMGQGYFRNSDPVNNPAQAAESVRVAQGYLEGSNVNSVDSMVQMIAVFRNYEAGQKVIAAIDDTLGKAVNEIGRVG